MNGFNLSEVFATVAQTRPDETFLVWGGGRRTYAELDDRATRLAWVLAGLGLGCRQERWSPDGSPLLAGHESGQDTVGLYLRNGPEYVEGMIGGYRARLAPYNVNFRYVADELAYLLRDAGTSVLVFHAEFAPVVADVRREFPDLVLIQVADDSGQALLPGALDYEQALAEAARVELPCVSGDDLFVLYTGGTTGMPKGVLWRQDDMYVTSMGGTPFGSTDPFTSYDDIADAASAAPGEMRILLIPPFMHAAAQWATFHVITNAGVLVLPDNVRSFDPAAVLRVAARERVVSIPVVGDAIALPLVEELERGVHDVSHLVAIQNGAAPLSAGVRARLLAALPGRLLLDAVGSSETGMQMTHLAADDVGDVGVFTPGPDSTVLSPDRDRQATVGEVGWLARSGRVPLGYLGDPGKTAATFPVIDDVRWSVPGDRAELLADGRIRLLGRESVTINTGGEKVFAEEVEAALLDHPAVRDALVVGRPSERWGTEVVAVVQLEDSTGPAEVSDAELIDETRKHLAGYKVPRGIVRVPRVVRSPAGKADYRWAAQVVADAASPVELT